jgi:hypothetical protein
MFIPLADAGIPEPDLVWYGKVMASSGGVPVRVTSGTLVWQIEPLAGAPAITLSTALTNVNDQFSFVLRVPCESPEPGLGGLSAAIQLSTPPASYRRVTVTLEGEPLALINTSNEFSPLPVHRGRAERIDLQLGAVSVDADGDGLADLWEQLHFGSLSANPSDDPDGDGLNNLGEFRAGTDPLDAQSRFEVVEVAEVPGGFAVRWSSQPERSYRVRRASTLLAAPTDYEVVQAGLAATPPMNEFVDTTVGAGTEFFYLIEIEE